MKKELIEGVVYVPEDEIQAAFQDRIKKLSADRIAAEDRAKTLQDEIDSIHGKLGTLDTMAEELENYKTQLSEADNKYNRHTAMADQGWSDPDLRDAVEWSYQKYQKGNEDAMSLGEWLSAIKEDPSTAPVILRPHLIVEIETTPDPDPTPARQTRNADPLIRPPKTNSRVKSSPVKKDNLIDRGLEDLEFYRQNREAIRKAYKNT